VDGVAYASLNYCLATLECADGIANAVNGLAAHGAMLHYTDRDVLSVRFNQLRHRG
jgi:hypothetical protein